MPLSRAAVLLALFLAGCARSPGVPGPGDLLPGFDLVRLDGGRAATSDWAGGPVIISVWATWCEPCRREMPSLQRLADSAPFAVVGISVDADQNLAREFLLQRAIRFVNLSDPERRYAEGALGLRAYPTTYVVAADGRIAAVAQGERDWSDPEVRNFVDRALAARALTSSRPVRR